MSLGIGLGLAHGGAVPFDPTAVTGFISEGNAGPSWCFTDTGATVPCAVGDPVLAWRTRRGTVITFTQAAAPTTARRLQQDAGGKYYVEFGGGTDDYLQSAPPASMNASVGACLGLACRPGVQTQSLCEALGFGGGNSTDTWMMLRGDGTALHNTKWQAATGGQSVFSTPTDSVAYTQNADVRLIGRVERVTLQTHRLWRDGVQVGTAARSAAMPTTTGTLSIGTSTAAPSRLFVGRIYGFLIYDRDVSDAQAVQIDAHLRSLMP